MSKGYLNEALLADSSYIWVPRVYVNRPEQTVLFRLASRGCLVEKYTTCAQMSDSEPVLQDGRWKPVLQKTEIALARDRDRWPYQQQ